MAGLHTWWGKDPAERYWLEITQRPDLGADLIAPQTDDAGNPYWGYTLIRHVRPGDIVFHWHKTMLSEPGIVAWSRAVGPVEPDSIVWQARGTAGRAHGPSGPEPAWRIALEDYTPLLEPVTQQTVREKEAHLRDLATELENEHGSPLYFPFALSEKRPVRTAQGYLTKLPAKTLDVFPGLRTDDTTLASSLVPTAPSADEEPTESTADVDGLRRVADPRVRRAIERHSVARAIAYFTELGYTIQDVGATRSYDLHATLDTETRHIEVKGTSGTASAVELTHREVKNAQQHQPTDLYVVERIEWTRTADGSITASGGHDRIWHDWKPSVGALTPIRYRYTLPE